MLPTPPRPAEHAERQLIHLILSGAFPALSALPAERDLAAQLGVTRPTLREALQRLSRDGWIRIQHGKPTRVTRYLEEGGLAVLARLADSGALQGLIPHLLEVRSALAPAFTRAAVASAPGAVAELLRDPPEDTAYALTAFDWHVQKELCRLSGNPVYSLVLNGFAELFSRAAPLYFAFPEARAASRAYYAELQETALAGDAEGAEAASREVYALSLDLWRTLSHQAFPQAERSQAEPPQPVSAGDAQP